MKEVLKKSPYLFLTVVFVFTRLIYAYVGVEFDYSWVYKQWHLIDFDLMQTQLIKSLWYFHYQPPLFNFFVGLLAKLPGNLNAHVTHLTYLSMTLFSSWMIYSILTKLRVVKSISMIAGVYFLIMPEIVLYENFLIQTWPSLFLLLSASWFLISYLQDEKLLYGSLFVWSLSFLCLTRSTFHHIYFFLVLLVFYFIRKHSVRDYFKAVSLPTLFLLVFMVKNFFLFNIFGVSSGLGSSLWKITSKINKERLQKMYSAGEISETFMIDAVKPVSAYGDSFTKIPEQFKGVKVLTEEMKSTAVDTGEEFGINAGHYGYISIFNEYKKDGIQVIKKNLKLYILNVVKAFILFFQPSWEHGWGIRKNQNTLAGYIDLFGLNSLRIKLERLIIPNGLNWPFKENVPVSSHFLIFFIYAYVVFVTLRKFVSAIKSKKFSNEHLLSLFFAGNIIYVAVVSNIIELSENDRYRVMVDPLVLILFVYYVGTKIQKRFMINE